MITYLPGARSKMPLVDLPGPNSLFAILPMAIPDFDWSTWPPPQAAGTKDRAATIPNSIVMVPTARRYYRSTGLGQETLRDAQAKIKELVSEVLEPLPEGGS